MKKQILLFLALIMSIVVSAQVTIQMEKDGGVYKVPCTVNGVKMKFIFDTGAATVSMSQTMAQFLLDGEYLSANDIKGTGKSVLADGSIVNHAVVNLRDVEIGGMHIHNIDATVIEGQNAPLLLGQTAISELGRVTIDGNRIVIHSAGNELTKEQLDRLEEQVDRYINSDSWAAAIDGLLKIDAAVGLKEFGLWELCWCYLLNGQYDDCIQGCNRWIDEFDMFSTDANNKENIYHYLAFSYDLGRKDYSNAIIWYQKELDILENISLGYYNAYPDELGRAIVDRYCSIGRCYVELKNYYQAKANYKEAFRLYCQYYNVTINGIKTGDVHDEELGVYLYDYAICNYRQNEEADGDEIMKMAALCGNQDAIDFCRKYNINYQVKSSKLFD